MKRPIAQSILFLLHKTILADNLFCSVTDIVLTRYIIIWDQLLIAVTFNTDFVLSNNVFLDSTHLKFKLCQHVHRIPQYTMTVLLHLQNHET